MLLALAVLRCKVGICDMETSEWVKTKFYDDCIAYACIAIDTSGDVIASDYETISAIACTGT